MKKITLLFTAIFALAFGATVSAQSTGSTPAPGATHQYSVTVHGTNSYQWSVTKGDLTTSAGADANITAATAATTNIEWATGLTVGDWYYVHLIETEGSCSNHKILPVQITENDFNLVLSANNATSCYDNAVVVSLDLTDPNNPAPKYVHGTAQLVFTVTPNNLSDSYSGYSFTPSIAYGEYTGLTETVVPSANASIDSGTGKVTVSNNEAVTLTYTVTNPTEFNNGSAVDVANYTATVSIAGGITSNGIADNGTGAKSGNTAVSRPNTSGIQTN